MVNRGFSQVVKAINSSLKNIVQVTGDLNVTTINVITDADTERLRRELTNTYERQWQDSYERLRTSANAGLADAVRESIFQTIDEISTYEAEEAPVDQELKARLYRLAAAVCLPHQTGGNAELCAQYLDQALELSEGEGLIQCRIIQALLLHENGDAQDALDALSDLADDEAIRLRFAISNSRYPAIHLTSTQRESLKSRQVDVISGPG